MTASKDSPKENSLIAVIFEKLTNELTNCMEQSPSCEASNHSSHFMEPKGSLPCSQQPAIGPHPELDASSSHLPTLFPRDPF
jgi:hypothetical protein